MKFLCVILIALLVDPIRALTCDDNECTKIGEQHPLCKYPDPRPSPACDKVISVELSYNEIREVITAHNKIRWYVSQGLELAGSPGPQPPAINMQILVWDDTLAQTAQRWVNQCNFERAPCVDIDNTKVEQIIGRKTYENETIINNITPSDIIALFYKQVVHMDKNQILQFEDLKDIKAYTQLVWAKTNRVGCGKIVYQKGNNYSYYMMCLYSPAGNIIGEPVYTIRDL